MPALCTLSPAHSGSLKVSQRKIVCLRAKTNSRRPSFLDFKDLNCCDLWNRTDALTLVSHPGSRFTFPIISASQIKGWSQRLRACQVHKQSGSSKALPGRTVPVNTDKRLRRSSGRTANDATRSLPHYKQIRVLNMDGKSHSLIRSQLQYEAHAVLIPAPGFVVVISRQQQLGKKKRKKKKHPAA